MESKKYFGFRLLSTNTQNPERLVTPRLRRAEINPNSSFYPVSAHTPPMVPRASEATTGRREMPDEPIEDAYL
jgi:hypothetical protein